MEEGPESNRTQTKSGEQRKALVTANPVKCRDYNSGLKKTFQYLRTNLIKEMKDLNNENFKLFTKEPEDGDNLPCS